MNRFDAKPGERPVPEGTGVARVVSDMAMSLISTKVRDWHLQRKAVVYIRQSTPQQVLEHRESADRQYGLVHRATLLGWRQDRVEVVDEDQGRSGQTAAGRLGAGGGSKRHQSSRRCHFPPGERRALVGVRLHRQGTPEQVDQAVVVAAAQTELLVQAFLAALRGA